MPPTPRCERLREFHTTKLAAVLRDTPQAAPQAAPALSAEEWRAFLALLRPHGVHALLAYRLSAWPGADGQMKAIRLYSGL